MRVVVHENTGLIDMRSFTNFGVNAKPKTDNPIGFFGTGLKYAIAVLCREGLEVTVWVGLEPYVFFTKKENYRGTEIKQIYMRRKRGVTARWFSERLPFTTELGKNWELWQAFRELHSNCLDENGITFCIDKSSTYNLRYRTRHDQADPEESPGDVWTTDGLSDHTRVEIKGDEYANIFDKRDEIFLRDAEKPQVSFIQTLDRPSKYLYFRGLRVMTLPQPSVLTWNFYHPLQLTEDRTLAQQNMPAYYVVEYCKRSKDREFLRKVLSARAEAWEGSLMWDTFDFPTTDEFYSAARTYGAKRAQALVHAYDMRMMDARTGPVDWREPVLSALRSEDPEAIGKVCLSYRSYLIGLIENTQ